MDMYYFRRYGQLFFLPTLFRLYWLPLLGMFLYAYYGTDTKFRLNYELFSVTTGPLIADVITNRKSYLRGYAFSNIQEFWAVSIEAFFENPKELKYYLPDLYRALCNVLNQDPATKYKIITNTYP